MAAPAYSLLDKAIGWVAPATGLRRALARNALVKVRAYEGANVKDGWIPRRGGASANADHSADSRMLRARVRSLVQNSPYAAKALDCLVSNMIGEGITPISQAKDERTKKRIDELWAQWIHVCDADGGTDFYGLQSIAYRAMEQDGECLIRLRARKREDGLPAPLQIQVLEIDYLDSMKTGKGSFGGHIFNGIETNALGQVVQYWLFDHHPGDALIGFSRGLNSKPVSADRIIHLFSPKRPGQSRGIPRFAPVIARLRDLAIYEDAELARKQNEALMSVFVSGEGSEFAVGEPEQTTADAAAKAAIGNLGTLQPGAIIATNGQTVTVAEPKAAPGYTDYVRQQLFAIAAGAGVTYEMLTGDLSQVNFSSSRVGHQEFRRGAMQLQWHVIIPRLCRRVREAFIDALVLIGEIPKPDYATEWSTPKWEYSNPAQDVKADVEEIKGGLSSLSEKLRKRNYVPAAVFKEMGEDYKALTDSGAIDMLRLMMSAGKSEDPVQNPSQIVPT